MIRVRGHIGAWPVDLSIELDEQDWERLAQQLPKAELEPAARVPEPAADALWQNAQDLLRHAGQLDGPKLLAELHALTGSIQAGKRLLVRLRHSEQVQVESGVDASVYRWVGAAESE